MSGTADLKPGAARARFREGVVATTAGWCDGWTQANLITVPAAQAWDVLLFAQRNPRSCPVLDVLDAGEVSGPLLDARHPHRPARLPRLPGRGAHRAAHRPARALARRPGRLPHRLQLHVRARAAGRGRAGAAPRARAATCRCTGRRGPAGPRARCPARWWSRCGRSRRRRSTTAVAVTARYPGGARRPGARGRPAALGIADLAGRTSATRSRRRAARCRCSGRAG